MPGFASAGHAFLSSLSEAPAGVPLNAPRTVAVDRLTGQVFVGDSGTGTVDVYSSSGSFLTQFGGGLLDPVGVGVDEATGLVYVADASLDAVLLFEPNAAGEYGLSSEWFGEHVPGGEFGQVAGVAVDNSGGPSSGDVYVVDSDERGSVDGEDVPLGESVVNVMSPGMAAPDGAAEGELARQLTAGKTVTPNGVAVSASSGRVLVADSAAGAVYTYSAEGLFEGKLDGKGSPDGPFVKEAPVGDVAGVAIDAASGDVYVAEAERQAVSQYSPSGEWEGWITSTPTGALAEPLGVALTSSGEVLVADAGAAAVDRFGPSVVVPGAETRKAAKSTVTRTTALVSGTVDGEGRAATYRFQYGETAALGSETTASEAGTGQQEVTTTIEGLHAGRAYYFRLVAENEDGVNYGIVRELETAPAVSALETGSVSGISPTGATLTGAVERDGLATRYFFQYGATETYGASSPEPPGEVAPGASEKEERQPRALGVGLAGLRPNTVYHYRLVAENSYGTTYGEDRTFATSGPPQIVAESTTGIDQTEATVHASIDPDGFATSYRVQYGETSGYGSEASGGSVGSGTTLVAVSVTLSNLAVGKVYHYRIVAESEGGAAAEEDQTLTMAAAAPIDYSYVSAVTATEAALHTAIDPQGHDTHYYFQYGTQSCQTTPSACTDLPSPPGEDIGEGSEEVAREAKVGELAPNTTYHYRVLDSNAVGATEGPEATFTTKQQAESSQALPDDRAWEMVTPPNKQGAPVEALTREGGLILASENGDSLTYVVDGALDEGTQGNRSPELQQVLATREATGWRSEDIATPSSRAKGIAPGNSPEYQLFTPDLSYALVQPPLGITGLAEPPLAEGVKQATMYLRNDATGTYLPLVTEANVAPGTVFGGQIHFVDATPDLSHVVIDSSVSLEGPSSAPGLYEWTNGRLSLLSVRPNGRPARGLIELGYSHTQATAISDGGSRIVWTTDEEEPKLGHLYLRDAERGETVQLDAAQGAPEPVGRGTARFQSASTDGSRIFFTDRQRLTPDSTAEPKPNEIEQDGEPDLYVCEVVLVDGKLSCRLTDLTVDQEPGQHADVQGSVLGTSEDGTSVYIVARGVLASNESGEHGRAVAGADNLYELHDDGAQWLTTFITTLSGEDAPEWQAANLADTAYVTARVSPDGRYFAFMSSADLTGYDNVDANPEANGARDEEVYLYDSQTASLRCVSCNPSGARPEGVLDTEGVGEGLGLLVDRRKVWFGHHLAGNIPGWTAESITGALIQSRFLDDDGRLFFNSPDDLVPLATNRKEDVYEYEPAGVGSCESATGGCVSLISGGSSSKESAFIEATPEGGDVFFLTAAQLLPQDTDTAFDIYDARECTPSSPCLSSPAGREAPCAELDTCRPAEPAQQIPDVAPLTSGQAGSGNIAAPGAARHAVEAKRVAKRLTRAQKLRRALESCRKRYRRAKKKRAQKKLSACERTATKRYGTAHAPKASARKRPNASAKGKPKARTKKRSNVRLAPRRDVRRER